MQSLRKINPTYSFGLLAGVAVATPLFGQTFAISARALSVLPILGALVAYLFSAKRVSATGFQIAAFAMLAVYVVAVLASASGEQWQFLASPTQWNNHSGRYIDAKLMMFATTAAVPIFFGLLFYTLRERQAAISGLTTGLACLAALAMAILLANSAGIARTNYATARLWYMGEMGRPNFSAISFGLLMLMGGLSALAKLSGNAKRDIAIFAFVGLLLFGTFWLNRRVDTVLFALAAVTIVALVRLREPSKVRPMTALVAPLIMAMLVLGLTNGYNLAYWHNIFGHSIEYRATFAEEVLAAPLVVEQVATTAVGTPPPAEVNGETAAHVLAAGRGLGSFAALGSAPYPHNIVLETYFESGILAVVALVGSLALLLGPNAAPALTRRLPPDAISISAIAVVLFGVSLKAGDITAVGAIMFFALAASAGAVADA